MLELFNSPSYILIEMYSVSVVFHISQEVFKQQQVFSFLNKHHKFIFVVGIEQLFYLINQVTYIGQSIQVENINLGV